MHSEFDIVFSNFFFFFLLIVAKLTLKVYINLGMILMYFTFEWLADILIDST